MHVVVCVQQLAFRHVSHVASPLVSPHDPPEGPGPGPGPPAAAEHALPHVSFAHADSAFSFAVPLGWAVSHAASHASSVQRSAQSMSAVQSVSFSHAVASAQQLVPRQESHVASPVSKPHALEPPPPPRPGPPPPPPHALVQLDCMQVVSASSSFAPLGCADMHAEIHASSMHASPHETSAVQSASFMHAVFSAQQLASMHVSHVASPVRRPHAPPAPPSAPPEGRATEGFFPALFASAETARATPPGRDSASFDCQLFAAAAREPALPGDGTLSMVVVLVHAKVIVDVMAITPKVIPRMCPPWVGAESGPCARAPTRTASMKNEGVPIPAALCKRNGR